MGIVGGSHCLVMCSAPCGALVGRDDACPSPSAGRDGTPAATPALVQPLHWMPRGPAIRRTAAFHAGRLTGYALAGGLAAWAMDSLAWLTQHAMALRPAWTLAHVAVMAWGLMMMVQAHQPLWVEQAGRAVWGRVRPLVSAPGGIWGVGVLWALMPCGLLYSALLVAALSGGPLQGALTMALFGLGSGLWLVGGPWAWTRVKARVNSAHAGWGTRAAGGLLCAVAGWALWMDLVYKPSLWCR